MSELSDNILRLRLEGKTYDEIKNELGCAKSTVSYYCGKGQKNKSLNRQKNLRKKDTLKFKVDSFTSEDNRSKKTKLHNSKLLDYQRTEILRPKERAIMYSEASEKIGTNPVCYLTGRKIDLSDAKSYELDHKIPRTRGGDNSLDNMGVTCKEANRAKHSLTEEEFIQLCKDVLTHNGYEIKENSK